MNFEVVGVGMCKGTYAACLSLTRCKEADVKGERKLRDVMLGVVW